MSSSDFTGRRKADLFPRSLLGVGHAAETRVTVAVQGSLDPGGQLAQQTLRRPDSWGGHPRTEI